MSVVLARVIAVLGSRRGRCRWPRRAGRRRVKHLQLEAPNAPLITTTVVRRPVAMRCTGTSLQTRGARSVTSARTATSPRSSPPGRDVAAIAELGPRPTGPPQPPATAITMRACARSHRDACVGLDRSTAMHPASEGACAARQTATAIVEVLAARPRLEVRAGWSRRPPPGVD